MPESFSYAFDISWGDNRKTAISDSTTCREMAIRNLCANMLLSYNILKEFDENDIYSQAALSVYSYNESYLQEIVQALSRKGEVALQIKTVSDSFTNRTSHIISLSGSHALPAWYWSVLACRRSVLQTRERMFSDAILATDKYDPGCWYHARDQGSSWRAWERALRGIGPTSRQMIYFGTGPVHWFYTKDKNRVR